MLEKWYKEGSRVSNIYSESEFKESIMYKGFKIIFDKVLMGYEIKDMRFNDFYSPVRRKDLKVFESLGFIKACDKLHYHRCVKRKEKYWKTLSELYNKRDMYIKKTNENPKFFNKKINNCNVNIHRILDLYFFYKSKVIQYEESNNLIKS